MGEVRTCPQCGTQLLWDALDGLCPHCLANVAFEPAPAMQDSAPAPSAASSLPQLSEKAGDKIGHYKLLQQIGEGGCGVVYMAEQEEPIRRRVALKVIKPGWTRGK